MNTEELHPEFKALAHEFRHLSVSAAGPGEGPAGILFFKDSRIVAPAAIRTQLIEDAHGSGHVGITKTYNGVRALYWWPSLWRDVKETVDRCQVCMMSRTVDPKSMGYHPLEQTHAPRQLFYIDLIGPVTGIRSEQKYVLTCLDAFSRLLATRPIPNRRAKTVVAALHSIFTAEMGVPARVVCDRGSEFTSMDTRALMEGQLGVKMVYIPAGEHQQNLVERAHRTLWSVLRAIRVLKCKETWRAALSESTYQYNSTVHTATGYTPNLLHHGYDNPSPGLLHPEGVHANPPPITQADRVKFTTKMREVKELIRGIVVKNQEAAHRRAAKYYTMRTLSLPLNSWVWVYNPRASPPEGDRLQNRKLAISWAGPYLFLGMRNEVMANVAKVDESGQIIRRFLSSMDQK